jgi:hypothetical protein
MYLTRKVQPMTSDDRSTQRSDEQEKMKAEILDRVSREQAAIDESHRRRQITWLTLICLAVAALLAALTVFMIYALNGVDQASIPDPEPKFPGAGKGTLTIAAPIRVEGAASTPFSDSILVTLSKDLADDGWTPVLSDGSCHVLSPGANTQFTGADGVQVTSFDQTTATHILVTKSADDLDCDLEYAVPTMTGSAGAFSTTIETGEWS